MSSSRPSAILLTPVLPDPGGTGPALRAFVWLTDLAQSHMVDVVVAGPATAPPSGLPLRTISFLGDALQPIARKDLRLGYLWPPSVLRHPERLSTFSRLADNEALDRLPPGPVDRIVVFRFSMHLIAERLIERHPQAERVLDLDDRESRTFLGSALAHWALGRPREALSHALAGWQFATLESSLPGPYGRVTLAAPEDAAAMGQGFSSLPSRIRAPDAISRGIGSRLLFVGTLGYAPNQLAVQFLLRRVLPALRRRNIEPAIDIVGRGPRPDLAAAVGATAGVRLFADAKDLAPHYAEAQAVLVPLHHGGGTKLKSIEAFAHARPVISTRHGMRGLAALEGEHYLGAETGAEFAAAIERLRADPALAARLAAAGHRLWQERYRL